MNSTVETAVDIRPFRVTVADETQGVQLATMHEVDEGNHFPAWQEPDIFTTELRAAFRSLRAAAD